MKEISVEGVLTYFKPKINYIPENFNLDEWASNQKLYGFEKFSKDVCAALISPLYTRAVYNKVVREEIKDNPRAFISLSSEIMYKIDKQYKKYLELFIKSGVLECNGFYSVGNNCKGYRFTETYANQPCKKHYNYKFGKEVADNQSSTGSLIFKYHTPTVTELIHNLDTIQLDYTGSMSQLKMEYQQGRITTDAYNNTRISLEMIHEQDYFATQDDYGRLHTNVVNLKKEYRNYLTLNTGDELASIDITNCQPFLSTLLLNSSFWKEKADESSSLLTIQDLKPKIITSLQKTNAIQTLIMFTQSVEDNEDVMNYRELVLDGCLYEFLQEKFQEEDICCPDRKTAKKTVYQILFSKELHLRTSRTAQLFKQLFPTVYELFNLLKKTNHAMLATLLQSMESQIVIEVIVKKFMAEQPGVPVFTIHDSVLVPVDKIDVMENILVSCTAEKVGYKPTISREFLKPLLNNITVAA